MPVKSILVYSVVYIYSHYTRSSISSAKGPKTRVYFGIENFIDNYFDREKPTSRDTSSSKWVVVDGKIKIYPFSNFWNLLCL